MKFYDIPGIPTHEISREGVLRNKKTLKIASQYVGGTGYYMSSFKRNGKSKPFRIHRLIAMTFIPNPNNLPIINHLDGNKLNNAIENLEWSTQLDNMRHAFRIGLVNNTGTNNGMAKLTEDQVKEIKRMLADGMSQYKIAQKIGGISRSCVMNIKNRGQWSHI